MAFSKARRLSDFIAADGTIPTAKFASGTITSAHIADTSITHADLHTDMNLTSKTVLVANASTGDSDTTAANTAFVQQEIAALVDSSPSALNTLNELAAALGDDANFSTTVTNSIATKLPLAGGTMTGPITMSQSGALHNQFTSTGSSSKISIISADGEQAYINYSGATNEMSAGYDRTSSSFRFANGDTLSSAIRMQINSAGNVGIGTTNPGTYQLAVDSGTAGTSNALAGIFVEGQRNGVVYNLVSNNTSNGADKGSGIQFRSGGFLSSGIIGRSDAVAASGDAPGYLTFHTSTDGTEDFTERMRIKSNGNVGIGTDNPAALLHLKSTANSVGPSLIFENTNNGQNMNIDYWNNAGAVQSRIQYAEGPASWNFIPNTSTGNTALYIAYDGKVGIGTDNPPSLLSIFGTGTSSPIAANAQQAYDNGLFRINNFGNSSVGLSIGSTGSNWTHIQTSYNEGTTAPLALNPFGGGVYIGTNTALLSGANLQIHGSTDAGGNTQNVLIKNTTTASYSSTAFVGTGRVLDFVTHSNNSQDFSAIRFTNPGGSRETAIAVVSDQTTTQDGTLQGDVVIQGYDGDGYIETQRFRANGSSSSTGQRRTGAHTSFAYINHTYTFDHAGYSTAGTPSNSNDHWLEVPLYSSYSSSAGGGWVEIDICWHATHAQAGHLHSYKLLWGSDHSRFLNVSVISSSANATAGSYNPYTFTSSSQLFRHPTSGDAYMTAMYIQIKGSTNHSGGRSITLRGVGHPSVKNIAPVIDHGSDSTPDGITPTNITSAITATG